MYIFTVYVYLDEYLVLELVGAGQVNGVFVSLGLEQQLSEYLLHDLGHSVLLRNAAVVLNGEDDRVPTCTCM